jgi:hypothetical protein
MIVLGWFIVIPVFVFIVVVNSYIFRSIDLHFTTSSTHLSNGFKYSIFIIIGILTTFILGFLISSILDAAL